MEPAVLPLPYEARFGLHPHRLGPTRAVEFEKWSPEDDNPLELIAGWVVPMSPGTFETGESISELIAVLRPRIQAKGWRMSTDARHRLPHPADTVVFPDLAVHATGEVGYLPGTQTVSRVPDLVIELLSEETFERDMAPHGAKFLAYQLSGVREYYYAWPDGRDAGAFVLEDGKLLPLEPDAEGFWTSRLLGCRFRLSNPEIR